MKTETIKYINDLLEEEKENIQNREFGGRNLDQARAFDEAQDQDLEKINEVIEDFNLFSK